MSRYSLILAGFLAAFLVESEAYSLSYREGIAYAWAPIFYKDYAHEFTDTITGFNPIDHPVSLFFDGNKDVTDNADNVFRLSKAQREETMKAVPLYYSFIETESHFYINYFFYHAVDAKTHGHAHDTENVWTVIEKDGSPFGRLVMQVASAHGFPMVYGPNLSAQDFWRSKVSFQTAWKVMQKMDRFSAEHHDSDYVSYVKRAVSKSIQLFVSSRSHAIYKFNAKAWESGKGYGGIYTPQHCLECETQAQKFSHVKLFRYELKNWDKIFFDEEKTKNAKLFMRKNEQSFLAGMVSSKELPDHLAPGSGEEHPRVPLFHAIKFKTPYYLSHPAAVHAWFSGSRKNISFRYLYNPYLRHQAKAGKSSWSHMTSFVEDLGSSH